MQIINLNICLMGHWCMKERFNLILSDQFVRISLFLSFLFVAPLVFIIIYTFESLPPLVPFFNSMPWGEERLYYSNISIFLPIILLLTFSINVFLSVAIYKQFVIVSRIILFNCFLLLLLCLLAYLQILFLTY